MTGRERILAAFAHQAVDSLPIWLMRQAGRYLPEYRALRSQYGFLELVKTPDLATEVTLQPLRRFDLDAAIIFSDILVVPEALGQPYYFRDTGGIGMEYTVRTHGCIQKLDPSAVTERLSYVADALKQTRKALSNTKALFGFGGSPWTLAAYMVEGGSGTDFSTFKAWVKAEPKAFEALMQILTEALIVYFRMQIEAGVDALQIFDSWGALCTDAEYWDLSLRWIERIITELGGVVPVILYAKGVGHRAQALAQTGAQGLSLDWTTNLRAVRKFLGKGCVLQGNLDPSLLCGDVQPMLEQTQRCLEAMQGETGYIFNLGHGMVPSAKIENVEALIQAVRRG